MPAINNMDNKIMPTNPNTQLKLFFNVAKKTMEKESMLLLRSNIEKN